MKSFMSSGYLWIVDSEETTSDGATIIRGHISPDSPKQLKTTFQTTLVKVWTKAAYDNINWQPVEEE